MARLPSRRLPFAFAALAALALVGAALPSTDAVAEPGTLRLGSDVWPPFTNAPGQPRVAIDLVTQALERSGVRAEIEMREDFEVLLKELRGGTLDGSPALWRNPERERFLLFSRPYLENRLVLLTRKGNDTSARSLASLAGKRIALVEGYAYGGAVEGVEGPVLVWGPSDQANLDRLLTGEVDYLLADEVLIHRFFERQGERARVLLAAGIFPIVERSLHLAVRRDRPDAERIVAGFDAAIRAMIADGSYNRVLGINWIRADVDGDGRSELVLGGAQAGVDAPSGGYPVFTGEPGGEPSARDSAGDEPAATDEPGYVVDGKVYPSWREIPSEYRVPVRPAVDPGDMPQPGISVFRF